ncbi:MAG: hypothetical protein L3J05_08300 [Robiginitomaculum sp.]|nr:hypothetical protein [Robiginitomaculum sp.]
MTGDTLKKWMYASAVPLAIMLIAMYLRPVWRDEVWAEYYTDISLNLPQTTERLKNNIHPPSYFYILHYWRMFSDTVMWEKTLNLLIIGGGFFAARAIGRPYPRQTVLFLLLCVGSYWLIYYAGVIRPYTQMFVLAALSVLVLARLLETKKGDPILFWAFLWAGLGALNCLSHYFALAWVGFAGLFTGLAFLKQGRKADFVIIGLASLLAVLPSCLWLIFTYENIGFRNDTPATTWSNLHTGLNQFLRGILVKFIGSNPAVYLIAALSLMPLLRQKKPLDLVLAASIVATILLIFIGHMGITPLIKERAFMVIIPAIMLLAARALNLSLNMGSFNKMWRTVPYVCAFMPFLFVGEYFKDREKLGEVRGVFASYPACETAEVLSYYRSFREGEAYSVYYFKKALPGITGIDIRTASAKQISSVLNSDCPIKAVALVMPRGDRAEHTAARSALRAVLSQNDLELPQNTLAPQTFDELSIGKGRNLLFVNTTKSTAKVDPP